MSPLGTSEIKTSLEQAARLFDRWGVANVDWCLLDGPAIKLADDRFNSSFWRDHLNIYVQERALPWKAREKELTLPPSGSKELSDLIQLSRSGAVIHLVPAARYYAAGFERHSLPLPSGIWIEAATLRGCSQVWSYKSLEIIENLEDYEGDFERIAVERLARLEIALASTNKPDIRNRLALLVEGYTAVLRKDIFEAKQKFEMAAGNSW
jgi:hypothetical protein